jgi:TorA maturation chaperone TorD
MESVERESAARARSDLYRYLAGLFLETAGEAAVAQLLRPETLDELAHAYGASSVKGLRALEPDTGGIAAEFDTLFRIPVAGYVPACESAYRDTEPGGKRREGHLYGPSCRAAARLMMEAGAEIPAEVNKPPDHIGVELLFLSFLCEQESEARKEGNADSLERWLGRELRFLRDHPSEWIESFRRRVEQSVPGGFYAGLSRLAEGVLLSDLRYLSGA